MTALTHRALLGAVSLLLVPGPAARAQAPLPIETALAQPSFPPYAPVTLSPDGRWVAYALQYPTRARRATVSSWFDETGVPSTANGARVQITDVRTGRTIRIGDQRAESWAPAWSPDGRSLAFYSNADGLARLWVYELATGTARRVSNAIVRAHRMAAYPRWTPDSRRIVLPILPLGTPLPESPAVTARAGQGGDSAKVIVWRADSAQRYGGQFTGGRSMNYLTSLESDFALVTIATGAVRTLAHGYHPLEYEVSPSGRFAVFTSERAAVLRPRWTAPYDVMVVAIDARKAEPRMVAAAAPLSYAARSVLWSPDGATLLYSATDSGGRTRFFAADTADWRPRRVAADAELFDTDSVVTMGQVAWWGEDGRSFFGLSKHGVVAVSMPEGRVTLTSRAPAGYEVLRIVGKQRDATAHTDGGRSLLVATLNDSTKRMGFARVDLATGVWRLLMDADRHLGKSHDLPTDVAPDGHVMFLSQDATHPADIWTSAPDFAAPRQVTHVAPAMQGIEFGRTRLIDFTTASGEPRRATLLLPTGYRAGQRYPLVVYPYPLDSRSNDLNVFGVTGTGTENMQLLATRGFAVLAPDVPPFDWKDHLRSITSIIQRGVDRTIELGVADSTRLGITGHSWGGYTTLAMITQTDRFGAAVMRGGMGDLVTTTASVQAGGFTHGLQLEELTLGAPPWEQPELYHRNSPLYLIDRVHTPLLILHGEGETTVPIFLADQVFAGLQRLGRTVEFVRYPNENHNESRWTYEHQRDLAARMIGWFERHLAPPADASAHGASGRTNPGIR